MQSRSYFAKELAKISQTHVERAIAFLYYYNITQEYEERSAKELAEDLSDERFPKPKISRLRDELRRSKYTIKGKRQDTFRIDVRRFPDLESKYAKSLSRPPIPLSDSIIPTDMVAGTRTYLERIANQINACYDGGFYDGCAVLCRRLMESLILEIYISKARHNDIQNNGVFYSLEKLIGYICSDKAIPINRNTPKTMSDLKQIGDIAAHDRVYITQQRDIDDLKARYRRMIDELLTLSGVRK